jgi:hypothetical protein
MTFSRLKRMLPLSRIITYKLVLGLTLLCSLTFLFSFAPKSDDEPVGKLVLSLQHWTDSIPQEKVYLHMDKPYYALGDTIWFKGYVTIGSRHQLSALSGALYVDLITARDSIIRSLKLPITSGMVMGNFIAADDVPDGNYRIRAYTRWMRNAGEEYFFDKTFTIGNPALSKKSPLNTSAQNDVQFFPESGSLVNGILSRVAFKAVGVNGLGADIKGKVIDETGAEVARLETLHAGMGNFMIRPAAGKTYSAQLTFADGITKTVALPKAADAGYVLGVYQPNPDSILVKISASSGLQPSDINLVAQTGDETIFASAIKITGAANSIWLDKNDFPSGIAQFTIYSTKGEPLNERIAFIRGKDQMRLTLETVKTTYKSREPVKINLQANDSQNKPAFGNFSVTVIDETKVPADESSESTILSNLLLTSDLKGYVEQPNYYFTGITDEVNRALDNLLLTQGYRRFVWKEQAGTVATKPKFEVEGLGINISGQVQNLNKKPAANATVTLMSLKAGVTKATTADSLGRFSFDGIFMTDSIKFTVQARGVKNGDKVKVILDSIPKASVGMNKNRADISFNNAQVARIIKQGGKAAERLTAMHFLQQVDIKSNKNAVKNPDITPQGMFRIPEGSADQTVTLSEAADCLTLSICLQGKLQGINIQSELGYTQIKDMRPSSAGESSLMLILDGRKVTDKDEISEILEGSILPTDVAKVMVVRSNQAIKSTLGGPALMIITKVSAARKSTYNPSVATAAPKGFNKVREFYSPRYDKPGSANLPDLRTTIYWNPYLKTGDNGKTAFSYFNADGPGTYKVMVEGINADGELGRQVLRYTVSDEGGSTATAAASTGDKGLTMITAPLDSFNRRFPTEKVYLHTDKPYYSIGDTLWFKSYLLDKVNLTGSKMSGLLYVELDSDSSEVVRRISIPIKEGLGWGQIPLTKAIFREGSYTLRAYTNWMQNFGGDYIFNQQLYIGTPSEDTWLVRSATTLNRVADKNQLQVDIKLNRPDAISSPVALKKVEVKIYDEWHYIYKEEMQTGLDGSLKLSQVLKDKADATQVRVQITSLEKDTYGKILQIPLNINRDQKIDLQFLPEGGNLVSGLKSTVGFKALSEDGKGTPVLGGIYDVKGNEVASFAATHNGMGSFEFTPTAGETYTAKILRPVSKVVVFPKIAEAGTVMHISNPEVGDNLSVKLAGLDKLTTDSACYLIGTSRGVVYYSQKVEASKPDIAIAKSLFPSGVARFTLFKGKTPLNERAVFIDNHDQLSITIKPNKNTYNKRDSVGLEIEVKDKSGFPVKGSFSLAVTDDTQVKADSIGNFNIATNLLINAELKGHIENPGYYLNRKDNQAWEALDNLMLTQGWTGYDWKDIFSPVKKQPKFEVEKEFKITGVVTNLSKKPVPNSQVMISSQKPSFVATTVTDMNGRYVFNKLPAIDSGSFFLQANNDKGKARAFGNISVEKFKAPRVPEANNKALPWYVNTDSTQLNYIKQRIAKAKDDPKLTGRVLKEVKIKAKKIIPESFNRNGAGVSDLAFDEEDIKESAVLNLYQLLKQKLPGLKVIDVKGMPTLIYNKHLVVVQIDGGGLPIQLNPNPTVEELEEELSRFQVATFKGMEVMYSEKNMVKYLAPRNSWINPSFKGDAIAASENNLKGGYIEDDDGNGYGRSGWLYIGGFRSGYLEARANVKTNNPPDIAAIDITTKNGNGWFVNKAPGAVTYRPLPVMQPQQFYSPKYNIIPSALVELDSRSTLYWEPNITTDMSGKAKVSFYTSDIKGKYTIKLSGVDITGGIGDATVKLNNNPTLQ